MIIGILMPLSQVHFGMAQDFMDGFKSCTARQEWAGQLTILKENVGFGGSEKEVYAKAEKLLVSEDADILIAYIDEKVTDMLYALVQSTGKLLLLVNPGANHPANWIPQATVVRLTLQHSFLCWLTGALAASGANKIAAYASSFYDCGYLHSADMVQHFQASGGEVVYNYVSNQRYDDQFEISPLTEFLAGVPGCEKILCVLDELPATLFYDRLQRAKPPQPLSLFASPMMLTSKALGAGGLDFSIEGYTSWPAGPDQEARQQWTAACKRPLSLFTLLGWESALVMAALMPHFQEGSTAGEEMVAHLKMSPLAGPRGLLRLDPDTHYYTAPVSRVSLAPGNAEPAIEWIPDTQTEWKDFTARRMEGAVTGWTNTYLCY